MISAILLSAGQSRRFGSPKALASWRHHTVIEEIQTVLFDAGIEQIIIVLGFEHEKIKSSLLNHKAVSFVYNKDYKFGQTSSFQAGVKQVSDLSEGFLLIPVDYPAIAPSTIRGLIEKFREIKPDVLIPSFEGKKGHPPIFNCRLKKEILALGGDVGINTIFRREDVHVEILPVDDRGVLMTFNTPEELDSLRSL